jgi:hypothetical protein
MCELNIEGDMAGALPASFKQWPEAIFHWIILVGGLEQFSFSRIYGIIIPIDFHIFQDS